MDFVRLTDLHAMMGAAGNCPGPVLDLHARLAAIELCERTRCWRFKGQFTVNGVAPAMVIPEQASIFEFEEASIEGRALTPVHYTATFGAADIGVPAYITQSNPSGIILIPAPEGEATVELSVFLTPRTDRAIGLDPADPMNDLFNVIPAFLMTRHAETIASGALARVMMMRRESWYEPQLAAVHQARFDAATARNFRANLRGQQRASTRTAYHDF